MDRDEMDLKAKIFALELMTAHALEKIAILANDPPEKFLSDLYEVVEGDAQRFVLTGNASPEEQSYVRAQMTAYMQRIVATASTGVTSRKMG